MSRLLPSAALAGRRSESERRQGYPSRRSIGEDDRADTRQRTSIIVRRLLIDIDGGRLGGLAPTHGSSLAPGHEGVAECTLSGGSFFYVQDCPCSVDIDEWNLDPGSFLEHREIAAQFEVGR